MGEGAIGGTGNLPQTTVVTTTQQQPQPQPQVDTPPPPQQQTPVIDTSDSRATGTYADTTVATNAVTYPNQTLPPPDQALVAASIKLLPNVKSELIEAAVRKLAGSDASDIKELMAALVKVTPQTAAFFLEGIGNGEPQGAKAFMAFIAETGLKGEKLESFIQKLGALDKNDPQALPTLLRKTLEENQSWFSFIPGIGGLFSLSDDQIKTMVKSAQSIGADIGSQQRLNAQVQQVDSKLAKIDALLQADPTLKNGDAGKSLEEVRRLATEAKAHPDKAHIDSLRAGLDALEEDLDSAWYDAELSADPTAAQARIEAIEDLVYAIDDSDLVKIDEEIASQEKEKRAADIRQGISGSYDQVASDLTELGKVMTEIKAAGSEAPQELKDRRAALEKSLAERGYTMESTVEAPGWGYRFQDPAKPGAPLIPSADLPPLSASRMGNFVQTQKMRALEQAAAAEWKEQDKAIEDQLRTIENSISNAKAANIPASKIPERDRLIGELEKERANLIKGRDTINARSQEIDGARDAINKQALLLLGKERVVGQNGETFVRNIAPPPDQAKKDEAVAKLKEMGIEVETVTTDKETHYQFTSTNPGTLDLPKATLEDWAFIGAVSQAASDQKLTLFQGSEEMGKKLADLGAETARHTTDMQEMKALSAKLVDNPDDPQAKARVTELMKQYNVTSTGRQEVDMTLLGRAIYNEVSTDNTALKQQEALRTAGSVSESSKTANGYMTDLGRLDDQVRVEEEHIDRDGQIADKEENDVPLDSTDQQYIQDEETRLGLSHSMDTDALPGETRIQRIKRHRTHKIGHLHDQQRHILNIDLPASFLREHIPPEKQAELLATANHIVQHGASVYIRAGESAGYSREQLERNIAAMDAGTYDPAVAALEPPASYGGIPEESRSADAPMDGPQGQAQAPTPAPTNARATFTPAEKDEAFFLAFSNSLAAAFGSRLTTHQEDDAHFTEKVATQRLHQREASMWAAEQKALDRSRYLRQALEEVTDERAERRLRAAGMRLNAEAHDRAVGDQQQVAKDQRQAEPVGTKP